MQESYGIYLDVNKDINNTKFYSIRTITKIKLHKYTQSVVLIS